MPQKSRTKYDEESKKGRGEEEDEWIEGWREEMKKKIKQTADVLFAPSPFIIFAFLLSFIAILNLILIFRFLILIFLYRARHYQDQDGREGRE